MRQWFKTYREELAVMGLFALLTVIISWPVLSRVDEVLIGDDIDANINTWADWWSAKAWQDPEITLHETDYLYYPNGANLVYHSFSHLNTVASLALQPVLGVLPAYNVTMLLNVFLAGVAMGHLARYLTGSTTAGVVAGVIFAFNSYEVYQTAHPVLVTIWPLPWATLAFWRAVQEGKVKWAVVAGMFVFLAAAASTLILILSAIWFTILVASFYLNRTGPRPSLKILVVFGLTTAILVFPLLWPLLQDAFSQNNTSFLINPAHPLVADIFAPLLPHWLYWFPQNIYLGIATLYLLLLAVGSRKKEIRVWLFLVVVAYLFSIGPRPQILGNELDITLPWTVLITRVLREPHRWNILFTFGVAMLGAYGWVAMQAQLTSRRKQHIAAAIVVVAIFGEYAAASFPFTRLHVSPFYSEILPQEPADVAIAILPSGRQEDKFYMYYQTIHGHKMTGGHISRSQPETFAFIYNNPLLRAGVTDQPPTPIPADVRPHLQQLAENHIAYIVLDKTLMEVEVWREVFPFAPFYEDDLVLVYATDPTTPAYIP